MGPNEMEELSQPRKVEKATKQSGDRRIKVSDYVVHIPKTIFDKRLNRTFAVGRYLGKGAYAKCFEVKNMKNGNKFACKILSKNILYAENLLRCYRTEIDVQSHIAHDNITQYISDFSDEHNLYLLLELCPLQSLKEMQHTRHTITEIECRFIAHEILCGVRYLHQTKIIHRDLKLSNVFLSHNMSVKIGDFGLSAQSIERDVLLYATCGTANYFAPEIVRKCGYSYEVDVWCVGVIMYFLLVGRAPFESNTTEELYDKIDECDYYIPTSLSSEATHMICEILQENRHKRPTADQCLQMDFICGSILPKSLPIYALLVEPRSEDIPLDDDEVIENFFNPGDRIRVKFNSMFGPCAERNVNDIESLCRNLHNVTDHLRKIRYCQLDDIEPNQNACATKIWVNKWIYSRTSGPPFAYQLTDETVGIIFEDKTKFSKSREAKHVDYYDTHGQSKRVTRADHPSIDDFKVKMHHFLEYNAQLQEYVKDWSDCINHNSRPHSGASQPPIVHSWFTTAESMVMYLSNGIVQINFLDHFKLILDSRGAAVTIIQPNELPKTFAFEVIESIFLPSNIHSRLKFALTKVRYLMGHLKESRTFRHKNYLFT